MSKGYSRFTTLLIFFLIALTSHANTSRQERIQQLLNKKIAERAATVTEDEFAKEPRDVYAAASSEPFEIEATWVGATQWMTGRNNLYETFNQSIAKGIDFFGSTITIADYVPVRIEFSNDSADWSRVGVFRRDQSYIWDTVGFFPGSAWDISDTANPRRLNICITEYDDGPGGTPPINQYWDPDTSALGNFEYLFVMNSDYDDTGLTYLNDDLNDNTKEDVLYGWWPRVVPGHTLLETLPASLEIRPIIKLSGVEKETEVDLAILTPGPTPYRLRILRDTVPNPTTMVAEISGSATSYTDSGLAVNKTYHYIVQSIKTIAGEVALSSHEIAVYTAQRLQVTAILPPAQMTNANNNTIIVGFDNPVVPSSINANTFKVFARWSGVIDGTFLFENGDKTVTFTANTPIGAGEWVTVSLAKNIQSTVPGDTFGGFSWNYWTATATRPMQFTQILAKNMRLPAEGQIQIYGGYGGDLNKDGYPDLTLINEISDDCRLLINDGTGMYDAFTVHDLGVGTLPSSNEGADFNGDGWMDLAIGTTVSDKVRVLMGNGTGGYNPVVSYTAGQNVRGVVTADIDHDGDPDVLTTNVIGDNITLLKNNGSGILGTPTFFESGWDGEYSSAVADANEDGHPDLFVGAMYDSRIIVMLNDGTGNLIPSGVAFAGSPWMITVGDVNRDGHVDVVSANSNSDMATVNFGDGNGGISGPVDYDTGDFPLAIELGDLNGDGYLDIVTSNYGSGDFWVHPNNGDGTFGTPIILNTAQAGSCTTLHDRDRDGDLDISGVDEVADILYLYENKQICCVGIRGNVNGIDEINILDINRLVEYMFNGDFLPCYDEGDVNGNGTINILDLVYLINYMFGGGPQPPSC